MIPTILEKYHTELEHFKRNEIIISENELEVLNPDSLNFKSSKYLGYPFIPLSMEYPKDIKGNVLIPTIQINFAEIPKTDWFPDKGILQIFLSQDFDFKNEDCFVQYITEEQLKEPHIEDFSFLKDEFYRSNPFKSIYSLAFGQSTCWASATDSSYAFRCEEFNDLHIEEFMVELFDEDEDTYEEFYDFFTSESMGSKIGGYGYFVYGDVRQIKRELKDHQLLLQIDGSDESVYNAEQNVYMHLFISKEDLKNLDFNNVYVDWEVTD
ncbi:Uncharacterized protein YwqG [Chryseobacterium arachidis]|uniref:Uncharacterized protein YwqG n=1 Tax=Chryseobacterium arachidis TaxID=1416778 RepID=A0A1M5HUI3_9FLAO|nr:YwqG family protein [Chryseobacterium arachidis]SHG19666.1 Uncharacterized protein YwqG [Chryseobacterium arachidis]